MNLKRSVIVFFAAFALLLWSQTLHTTVAQIGAGWMPPVTLSEGVVDDVGEPAAAFAPVIVADDWGQIHTFWGAKTVSLSPSIGNTIYYAYWDGQNWSGPHDIIYVADINNSHALPKVAVDSEGQLHLVWLNNGALWYSRASVWEAASARAWAAPVLVSEGSVSMGTDHPASIVVDSTGAVHVVHCLGLTRSSVVHTYSLDGVEWSTPTEIQSGIDSCQVNLVMDNRERLHLAYRLNHTGNVGVYYTRSEDLGETWSTPTLVDQTDDRYIDPYTPNTINIVAREDEVHVSWLGAPRAQRWHRWSSDGGNTWSLPQKVSPYLTYSTNPPALAIDSLGNLHMVTLAAAWAIGAQTSRPYHVTWRDGEWGPPVEIAPQGDERAGLALVGGNTLYVVWDHRIDERLSIWASRLVINAPTIPLETVTSPAALQPPTPGSSEFLTPTPTQSGLDLSDSITPSQAVQAGSGAARAVIAGGLAAALLVGLVFIFKRQVPRI